MATCRRKKSATGIYHVVVKGINKEKIFYMQREKLYLKKIILKHLEKLKVEIYSYCIMSNHAHFIIRAEIEVLSLFMAKVLAEYASYYNYKHRRNGHVFQNRFMSECIENDRYFWTCLRYIHLNPVKANMVKNPVRYKYSSMTDYMTETTGILDSKAIRIYKEHFRDYSEFEDFHRIRQTELFLDYSDDVKLQYMELALYIAEKLYEEKKLTLLHQVFEEKENRKEYIKRLCEKLKIGVRRAEKLCTDVYNKVESG
ncbi:transposase [Faecalimonas umbilicata]|nr:transposase [Faecalimonas umbilicata]